MIVRLSLQKCLTYLFCILIIIPFFSSEIGIDIMGSKINISDMLMFGYLGVFLFRQKGRIKILHEISEIKGWIFLLLLWSVMIPIGLFNGASPVECFRLVRNLLYILITYFVLKKNFKQVNMDTALMFFSVIISINTIVNSLILYRINGWFKFYRANGVLTVFLFCYLFFRIRESKEIKELIFKMICCILLALASFFSQERTQLITILLSCIIAKGIKFFTRNKFTMRKNNLGKSMLKITAMSIILIVIIYYVLRLEFVQKYIDYYITYRLQSGKFFGQSGLSNDGSYQARLVQIYNIIGENTTPLYFLIGRGTCAYYKAAQGMTYIVDSAILWTFKDLGIIGLSILIAISIKMMKLPPKYDKSYQLSIVASGLSLVILMIYNPSFVYTTSVGFAFGLFSYLKYKSIIHNELNVTSAPNK